MRTAYLPQCRYAALYTHGSGARLALLSLHNSSVYISCSASSMVTGGFRLSLNRVTHLRIIVAIVSTK